MCCSRVCNARRRAGAPTASWLTPTMRPGMARRKFSRVAKNAACGPPNPIGTPKRWALPATTSAPISPGGVSKANDSRSAATIASAPASCAALISARKSRRAPVVPGYCSTTAKGQAARMAAVSPGATSTRRHPTGVARVCSTARVCGCRSTATAMTALPLPRLAPSAMATPSATAVASSSSEALATGSPVRSAITVWKFSNASSRPCEISDW